MNQDNAHPSNKAPEALFVDAASRAAGVRCPICLGKDTQVLRRGTQIAYWFSIRTPMICATCQTLFTPKARVRACIIVGLLSAPYPLAAFYFKLFPKLSGVSSAGSAILFFCGVFFHVTMFFLCICLVVMGIRSARDQIFLRGFLSRGAGKIDKPPALARWVRPLNVAYRVVMVAYFLCLIFDVFIPIRAIYFPSDLMGVLRMVISFPGFMLAFLALAVSSTIRDRRIRDRVRLADFTLCLVCAYQLQGLSAEGRCPECGADYLRAEVQWKWDSWIARKPGSRAVRKNPALEDEANSK